MSRPWSRCALNVAAWSWCCIGWIVSCSVVSAAVPNILFCIADDASPHFGIYGCDWAKTPNIDRLGKNGLVFENAYTPTAKCAPSRASILTGRNPWQLKEAANHMCYFPAEFKAFSEVLEERGVTLGARGKVWGPGVAKRADGSDRDWGLKMVAREGNPGDSFRSFLKQRDRQRPFFFWFGSSNPHRAYDYDSGIKAGKKTTEIDRVPGFWPDNDTVRRDMLDYAIEIEAFDREVGSLMEVLEAEGELANTLVIVTSDHGMPFPRSKGHTYEISNHVPLVAHWPSGIAQPGGRVKDLVSFIDLAPTFLDLLEADATSGGMASVTGSSFRDLLVGKPSRPRDFVLVGRERNDWGRPRLEGYPVRGIVHAGHLYLMNLKPDRWPCCNPETDYPDTDPSPTKTLIAEGRQTPDLKRYWEYSFGLRPAEELFDLRQDVDCLHNLAGTDSHREQQTALKEKLITELKRQQDPRLVGDGDQFDRYLPTREDWIGKYERGELTSEPASPRKAAAKNKK